MALTKKKTRKRLVKQVRKLVKKHGPEAVTSIVTEVIAATATQEMPNAPMPVKAVREHKKRKPMTLHTSAATA